MGCGRCLSSEDSSTRINNILHQDIQLVPNQDAVLNISEEQDEKSNDEQPQRTRSVDSLTQCDNNSRISLTDLLNRNCIQDKMYSSGLSVISQSENCTCYLPPLERKRYTHQMVVVAPLSGKFDINSLNCFMN